MTYIARAELAAAVSEAGGLGMIETLTPDATGNRTANGSGASLIQQGKNNLIVNGGKKHTIAMLGVDDLIVIHTDDATLIMPRSKAEELKNLHGMVEERLK